MERFCSYKKCVQNARKMLEQYPLPTGVVDGIDDEDEGFDVTHAQASAVKYIGRNVSAKHPDGMQRDDGPRREVLREVFGDMDISNFPEEFQRMVGVLLAGNRMELSDMLYEAAFKKEILDLRGKWNYIQFLQDKDNQIDVTYGLLAGAGFPVVHV